MKPFCFIEDLIKQLQNFSVDSVTCELHVGGNGIVGDGNSIVSFTLAIPKKKELSDKELEKMLG